MPARAAAMSLSPRAAMIIVFFVLGCGFGFWGGAAPTVAARANVAPDVMGAAYSGFVIAYLIGMTSSGIVARFVSIKTMVTITVPSIGLLLAMLLIAASPIALFVGLAAFGAMAGATDLGINTEGTTVEGELRRPVLAGFHGSASVGVAASSILGSLISVELGALALAVLTLAVFAAGTYIVIIAVPQRGLRPPRQAGEPRARPTPVLLVLGLVVGFSVSGEMAAALFSAPFMAHQSPDLAAWAGAGATAFALFQALTRFQADRLRARFGDPLLLACSLAIAGVGFAVVALSTGFAMSAAGFALIGIGTACCVPCGFALSVARSPLSASSALAVVALVSAVPRVPTPYVFGEAVTILSYGAAFALYASLFVLAVALMAALPRKPAAPT